MEVIFWSLSFNGDKGEKAQKRTTKNGGVKKKGWKGVSTMVTELAIPHVK